VLVNRLAECEVLDGLVEAVRLGKSQALVVCGEPGVGKSALLEYLVGRASACRVIRIAGVQSEMELAFAGLHQLCAPLLGRDEALPGPQRDALRTAFGLGAGPAPDQFLVGLAALGLLAEEAREFYRASIAAGDPLTGRQLGRMYSRSPSWGRERIGEVKAHDQGKAGRAGSRPTRDVVAQWPVRSDGTGTDPQDGYGCRVSFSSDGRYPLTPAVVRSLIDAGPVHRPAGLSLSVSL